MCAKPVITHKSFVWNEHLSYLDDSFSRVANQDNIEEYAQYLVEFIKNKPTGVLKDMGMKAREKALGNFAPKVVSQKFEKFLDKALQVKF